MKKEIIKNQREFNKKFPSGLYICSNCGHMNFDKYICQNCGWRSDGLFKTMNKGYRYKLKEENFEEEIFIPIEKLKEDK